MNTLTRYVLFTFLKNYLISFGVLVGMYITLDMVLNFDVLFEFGRSSGGSGGFDSAYRVLRDIVDFYFYQSVLIFVHLAPVIPVVAAAFTLMRMTRFNELVAVLAAGVSLKRLAAPIIIATAVLSLSTLAIQEALIPTFIPKLIREHQDVGRDTRRSFAVRALEDARGNILVAAAFVPSTPTAPAYMLELDLVVRDQDRRPVAHVRAERGTWDPALAPPGGGRPGAWRLTNGKVSTGLLPDDTARGEDFERDVALLDTSLTPEEIILYRSRDFVELLPTSRINELLAQPRNYGVVDLLRVKHFRWAQYLNNIALLMLALPCVMTREPRTLKAGGAKLLALVGLYLGSIFFAQHLAGSTPPTEALRAAWPALMAALPLLVFGPLAVYAFDRIRT